MTEAAKIALKDEIASVDFGAYGRLPAIYPRGGSGNGEGWINEFETVRFHLGEFIAVAPELDVSDLSQLRLDFGPSYGSPEGRVGLDDIVFSYAPGEVP